MKRFKDVLIASLKFKAKHGTYGWFRSAAIIPASVFLMVGVVQAQIHKRPPQPINRQQQAMRISMTSFDALVLDMRGDGLDFGGSTRTDLATGEMQNFRWTKPNTGNSFLVLDMTSARAAGFDVRDKGGQAVDGLTLLRGGLSVRAPDGAETVAVNGWQMLSLFDSTQDGRINSSDPVWQSLKLFTDANADGTMGGNEIKSISNSNVRDLVFTGPSPSRTDGFGNTLVDGSFTRVDGSRGLISDVTFARITE